MHTSYSRYFLLICEELIREDWKKLLGNLPIEDIPLPQNHIPEDDWGLDSENE
jgi:hypothetical protein